MAQLVRRSLPCLHTIRLKTSPRGSASPCPTADHVGDHPGRVEMPPVFLDVLSMIALRPGQPEARSSGSVPSVPQCQAKAEALLGAVTAKPPPLSRSSQARTRAGAERSTPDYPRLMP